MVVYLKKYCERNYNVKHFTMVTYLKDFARNSNHRTLCSYISCMKFNNVDYFPVTRLEKDFITLSTSRDSCKRFYNVEQLAVTYLENNFAQKFYYFEHFAIRYSQ